MVLKLSLDKLYIMIVTDVCAFVKCMSYCPLNIHVKNEQNVIFCLISFNS